MHAINRPPHPLPMGTITAIPNGPNKAEDITVLDADGNTLKQGTVFLCRCGHSANKPFCDGAHTAAGFEG